MRRTENFPLAYLITFRTYGTWLHGDERGSVDRWRNTYGSPTIPPSNSWRSTKLHRMNRDPVRLDGPLRRAVDASVRDTCRIREWQLHALNVRTNHVHAVVTAERDPSDVLTALKANATRQLREAGVWNDGDGPWSQGGSKRYLWTTRSLALAVAYVVDGQGGPIPDFV